MGTSPPWGLLRAGPEVGKVAVCQQPGVCHCVAHSVPLCAPACSASRGSCEQRRCWRALGPRCPASDGGGTPSEWHSLSRCPTAAQSTLNLEVRFHLPFQEEVLGEDTGYSDPVPSSALPVYTDLATVCRVTTVWP